VKKFGILIVALFLMAMMMTPVNASLITEKHIGKVPVGSYTVSTVLQNTSTTCMVASMSSLYKFYGYDTLNHAYSNIYGWAITRPPYTGALSDADVLLYLGNNHFYSSYSVGVTSANKNTVYDTYIQPRINVTAPLLITFFVEPGVKHTFIVDGYKHDTVDSENRIWIHDPNWMNSPYEFCYKWEALVTYSIECGGNPVLFVPPLIQHMN
jgi:hypothetical protein